MSAVKVSIAQINALVGDLTGNAQRVLKAARLAHAAGAKVLLTPELVLTGYPPEDIIGRNCRFLQGEDREQEEREEGSNGDASSATKERRRWRSPHHQRLAPRSAFDCSFASSRLR